MKLKELRMTLTPMQMVDICVDVDEGEYRRIRCHRTMVTIDNDFEDKMLDGYDDYTVKHIGLWGEVDESQPERIRIYLSGVQDE